MNSLRRRARWSVAFLALAVTTLAASQAWATKLVLKDGRVLVGRVAQLGSLAEKPAAAKSSEGVDVQSILLVDDELRRIFIPKFQVANIDEKEDFEPVETLHLKQPVSRNGLLVGSVGPIIGVTQFDEYAHRALKMGTNQGPITVIQGITVLTPHYAKVESLQQETKPLQWDQRIATSSIPLDVLEKILNHRLDPSKLEHRLIAVRFYLQAERYKEAEEKLKAIINDFPEAKSQYQSTATRLHQAYARRILSEARSRRDAGQHNLAVSMLQHFPTDDVAGETLIAVRQLLEQYQADVDRGNDVLKHVEDDVAKIDHPTYRDLLNRFYQELKAELTLNTLPRMAAYKQSWDDATLKVEDRLALAVSGWLIGSDDAVRKLPVAVSLYNTRDLLRKYLVESGKANRDPLMEQFLRQEAATPELVAALMANMRPPAPLGESIENQPGLYRHDVPTVTGEEGITYSIQLPAEYDPYRVYPTIVTLHAGYTNAEQQIDWWAGPRDKDGSRMGQASRHGYIVLAPQWGKTEQRDYKFSAREHAAVLNALRDACRRYAIDTDRVYLSGHSMGGDAAWDIGVSHPDLWAGIIPITSMADKYINSYWENAKLLPMYFVAGELDSDRHIKNAQSQDRYMRAHCDLTIVEYQGRGHEHFTDEILNIFDWMARKRRNFFPRQFKAYSMRTWDSYFYWVEMSGFPDRSIIEPDHWPPPVNFRPAETNAQLTATNGINVTTAAKNVTVWLCPDIINFSQQPIRVTINGTRVKAIDGIEPSLPVLLEDARTRGDRRHPFWAKVEIPGHRINAVP